MKGQLNDSSKVKKIYYDYKSTNKNGVLITKSQYEAISNYEKGYSLNGNHEYNKAIIFLKEAIEIDSTGNCGTGKNGMAYSELAYSYTRLEDFNNAIIYFDKAIQINKYIPEPYENKTVMLSAQGKYEEALKTINLLIKNIHEYDLAYAQRGFIFISLNKPELALNDFRYFLSIMKAHNQEEHSKALVDDVRKEIKSLEEKIKK